MAEGLLAVAFVLALLAVIAGIISIFDVKHDPDRQSGDW
jgi:hypothetical protein